MFFFQAEDGIRDDLVTGVQTCALPILQVRPRRQGSHPGAPDRGVGVTPRTLAVITAHACPHSEIGAGENGGMSVYAREMAATLAERQIPTVFFTRKEDPGAPATLELEDGSRLVHIVAGPQGPISQDALFYHLPEFYRGVAQWARDDGTE